MKIPILIILSVLLAAACSTAGIRPNDENFDKEIGTYIIDRSDRASLAHFYEATNPDITVVVPPHPTQAIQTDNDVMCRSQHKNTTWVGGVYEDGIWERRLCAWNTIGKLRAKNYCEALDYNGQKFELVLNTSLYAVCMTHED